MKVSVSITEHLYRASLELSRRLGLGRAELYGMAIEEFLDHHRDDVYVNPVIRDAVEPILAEEFERAPRDHVIPPEPPAAVTDRLPAETPASADD